MRDFDETTLWRVSEYDRVRGQTGGSAFARLSGTTVLPTTLLADLRGLELDAASVDPVEVVAACIRHREPALLCLQYDGLVWPVTLFPNESLYHSPRDFAVTDRNPLARLTLLSVEPPGVRPPGHWLHDRIAEDSLYRPLAPLLWTLALDGPREHLLAEIAGTAAYRAIRDPDADQSPALRGVYRSAGQRLRRETVALRDIAAWPGMTPGRASRLLNGLYLTSSLLATRAHPAARGEPRAGWLRPPLSGPAAGVGVGAGPSAVESDSVRRSWPVSALRSGRSTHGSAILERPVMLEKLPDVVGHLLRDTRAGLDQVVSRRIDLRAGSAAIAVTSLAFVDHAPMPARYTSDGPGVSPPLQWSGVPAQAASVVLLVEDADAPTPHPLVHAIVVNLPAGDGGLAEGALDSEDHAGAGLETGPNSFLRRGWLPPDPPPGHGVHRYAFQVFALDRSLDEDAAPGREALVEALREHALASGCLIGTYARPDGSIADGAAAGETGLASA